MAQREKVQQGLIMDCGRNVLHGLLFFIVLIMTEQSFATDKPVVVVSQHNINYHNTFVNYFREELLRLSPGRKVIDLDIGDKNSSELIHSVISPNATVIVTVGTKAAKLVSSSRPSSPLLHTLITIGASNNFAHDATCSHKTLYIDQPYQRKIALIAAAFPNIREVGILISSASKIDLHQLKNVATHYSRRINSVTINNINDIKSSLEQVAMKSQLLLTLPDTSVITPRTVKTLIHGAYHRELPIVGYSRSMVKAGALIAVYSTPEQMAIQSARLANNMSGKGCSNNNTVEYPDTYSLAINYQVARALNITLPEKDVLLTKMQMLGDVK